MKIYHFFLIVITAIVLQSCIKDPLEDITAGGWNHERTVISLMFENQV